MKIRKSAAKAKGKAKMDETESPRKMKQREQGFTDAEWDDVLARVVADEDFVQLGGFFKPKKLMQKCSEEIYHVSLELVNQRKKFFAQHRAEAKRNKPITPASTKGFICQITSRTEGGYSIKQLKSLSFEQVKEIFETTMRKVQSFVPMGSELEVQRLKRAGQEVLEEPVKRQKIGEASGSGEESAEKEKELSEEELQKLLVIVPVEEVYNAYQIFAGCEKFNKDDMVKLCDLVKERFSTTEPTDDKEKELWVELKRLFEPDNDDTLWKLQRSVSQESRWTSCVEQLSCREVDLDQNYNGSACICLTRLRPYRGPAWDITSHFIDHALWEVIVNGDSVSPVASASAVLKEDANLKLVRSLPSAWNNIALIMRNKSDLDTLSMDDLYNNLKVYESEIKGKSSSSSNSQNVAFCFL
ncbi:hypothetical protein Tco_1577561 [Tanacetum coccineum]